MSVRGTLGGVLAAATVLIIGWQAGSAASTHASAAAGTTASGTTGTTGTAGAAGTAGATDATGTSTGYADGTYTGAAEQTRYGDMQVKVTISGGQITDVTALQVTDNDPRSQQISARAVPVLHDEVLAAQSANVSTVSGATYTSDGYLASLQSALDQA